MRTFLTIVILLMSCSAFSQQAVYSDSASSVVVKKDPRIDILSAKQSEINRRAVMMNITHARGYRIQVINTQNRDDANTIKAEMLRRFPEQKTYLIYKAPNFRVRVGNFLSQRDAESIRKMIASLYPNKGIYLVSDMIEYRPKEDEDFTGME